MVINSEILFDIACIIDNEFIGSKKTFTATRSAKGYHFLSTNVCDWSSLIRVYNDYNTISKIERLGDDTGNWQEIMPSTMERINQYLRDNK